MEYKSAQKQLIKIFLTKKVIYQPKITFKQGHYIKIPYFHEFSKQKKIIGTVIKISWKDYT